MKFLRNITNYLSHLPKQYAVALIVAGSIVLPLSVMAAAWGPSRPTYTIENPAPHVAFNSITNNPNYGDERQFFDVRDKTQPNAFSNSKTVTDGQRLVLRTYVHNNANPNLNDSGEGIAQNTKISIPLDQDNYYENYSAISNITADNAQPGRVYDELDLSSSTPFKLDYIEGSAKVHTNAADYVASDSIVTNGGALIGYEGADGTIPGCFQYTAIVTIEVEIEMQEPQNSDISVDKAARKSGTNQWKDQVGNLQPGDLVDYRIVATNTGETTLTDMTIGDNLPPHMSYVQDSATVYTQNSPDGRKIGNNITTGGTTLTERFAPGGVVRVVFQARVNEINDFDNCGPVNLTNVGVVASPSDQFSPEEDTAVVQVIIECEDTELEIEKTVRKKGTTEWTDNLTGIEEGDHVEYRIRVVNTSDEVISDLTVGDNLPPYVTYVEDSAKVYNSVTPNGASLGNNLTTGGVTLRDAYAPDAVANVIFEVVVNGKHADSCEELKLTNVAIAGSPSSDEPYVQDIADLNIDCGDQSTAVCSGLFATPTAGVAPLSVDFTAVANRNNGAKIVAYNFDFDNDGTVDQTVPVDDLDSANASHTYGTPGDYTAKLTVTAQLANGSTITAPNVNGTTCTASVNVEGVTTTDIVCTGLLTEQISQNRYKFTVSTEGDSEILGYLFGIVNLSDFDDPNDITEDDVQIVPSDTNMLSVDFVPGDYFISASVVTEDGETDPEDCFTILNVTDEPGVNVCESISSSKLDANTFKFTVSARGDDAPEGYIFMVDGETHDQQDSNMLTVTLDPAKDHTVKAAVVFPDGPTDFDDCVSTIEGDQPPSTPPKELPKTGGAAFGMIFGSGAIASGIRSLITSKREIALALLG